MAFVKAPKEELDAAFANIPSGAEAELTAFIKTLDVGDGFKVEKGDFPDLTERQIKRRTNKAGSDAKRDLIWAPISGGFMVRVKAVEPTVTPAPEPEPKTEPEKSETPATNGKVKEPVTVK